jgi:long-chain acyl-CoA synthetase
MYPGKHAATDPQRPAFIMAQTGAAVTYGELETRTNRLAHLLRARGLSRLDHNAIFMENSPRYLEACGAGERAGLYYTCINSYLTAEELAYIVNNSEAKILVTSEAKRDAALAALGSCPKIELCLVVDGRGDGKRVQNLDEATAPYPVTPIADEALGTPMLYSSGTTGRPKGILRPLPMQPPSQQLPLFDFLVRLWRYRDRMIYLSPAPLYHSAPQAAVNLTIRQGGTAIIMERFDPERYLELVQTYKVTHSQLVPTMFSRLLKLPEAVRRRYDLSSLEVVIHAAAPCPVQVKEQMIEWWGPILYEYYAGTEGNGFVCCNSEEWLAHRGTVGRSLVGEVHILDQDGSEAPPGEPGTIYFGGGAEFTYHNDPDKTAAAHDPGGHGWTTLGDVGYLDGDGFLYLTDRTAYMIITGGVNVYPQEAENVLAMHPKVADVAVFGIPHDEFGEEVKAVVEPLSMDDAGPDLERELVAYCRQHLADVKCPRTVDFRAELPRHPTGKLYKRLLKDEYWKGHETRII